MDMTCLSDTDSSGISIMGCISPVEVSVELNNTKAASGSVKKLNSIPGLILPTPVNFHKWCYSTAHNMEKFHKLQPKCVISE
jgi:hypothetical protein